MSTRCDNIKQCLNDSQLLLYPKSRDAIASKNIVIKDKISSLLNMFGVTDSKLFFESKFSFVLLEVYYIIYCIFIRAIEFLYL